MTKDEALRLALEALTDALNKPMWNRVQMEATITAIKTALEAKDEIDWKDMYEKEKRRSEMWVAKYEKDIGPLEKAVPQQEKNEFNPDWDTQAVLTEEIQRMAKRIEELEAKGKPVAYMSHNKENFVSADDVGNSVPNWTDYYPTPLYATPSPCPTCIALSRTVMMDQTGRDA